MAVKIKLKIGGRHTWQLLEQEHIDGMYYFIQELWLAMGRKTWGPASVTIICCVCVVSCRVVLPLTVCLFVCR